MNISEARVLLTGGGGGIGSAVASELLRRGAAVLLVDRDEGALQRARASLASFGERVGTLTADLTLAADRDTLCSSAAGWRGGVNVLVNNAGVNHFGMFEDHSALPCDAAAAAETA